MRPEEYPTSRLVKWLEKERILTWDRIAQALGNPSRITIFRKLAQLGARASYSHRGRYQTLDRIAPYDENGLWSFRGVRFSRHGTLVQTLVSLVEQSRQGYLASELQALVQVRVHNALAHLYATKRLDRELLAHEYLYLSPTSGQEQRQRRSEAIQPARARQSPGLEEERSEWGGASVSCSRFSTKSSVASTWDSSRSDSATGETPRSLGWPASTSRRSPRGVVSCSHAMSRPSGSGRRERAVLP